MIGFKWSEMFDAMAYEIDPTPASLANESDIVSLMQFIYTNTNVNIERYWRMLYKLILSSNLVIDKAQAYIDLNGDDANKIVNEPR